MNEFLPKRHYIKLTIKESQEHSRGLMLDGWKKQEQVKKEGRHHMGLIVKFRMS